MLLENPVESCKLYYVEVFKPYFVNFLKTLDKADIRLILIRPIDKSIRDSYYLKHEIIFEVKIDDYIIRVKLQFGFDGDLNEAMRFTLIVNLNERKLKLSDGNYYFMVYYGIWSQIDKLYDSDKCDENIKTKKNILQNTCQRIYEECNIWNNPNFHETENFEYALAKLDDILRQNKYIIDKLIIPILYSKMIGGSCSLNVFSRDLLIFVCNVLLDNLKYM